MRELSDNELPEASSTKPPTYPLNVKELVNENVSTKGSTPRQEEVDDNEENLLVNHNLTRFDAGPEQITRMTTDQLYKMSNEARQQAMQAAAGNSNAAAVVANANMGLQVPSSMQQQAGMMNNGGGGTCIQLHQPSQIDSVELPKSALLNHDESVKYANMSLFENNKNHSDERDQGDRIEPPRPH